MSSPAAAVDLPREVLRALRPPSAWLSSWTLAVALIAVFVLLLAAVVVVPWVRRRRTGRRHRRLRVVLVIATTLGLVLAGSSTANAVSGYVPNLEAARFLLTGSDSDGGGTVTTLEIGAPQLNVPDSTTYVYLPPGYASSPHRRYPVAYLLHGSPGRSADWFAAGDAARTLDVLIGRGLVPPMIVVAPDDNGGGLHDTECLDQPGADGAKVETYLRTVVVPTVDARFRTDARPAARIVGGMSAGGFCALDQGLRHQDTYGPIVALEPFGDPGSQFVATLGRKGFDAVSPSSYLPTITEPGPVPVFLGTGALATEKSGVDALTAQLRDRGWPVVRRDVAGQGHTWTAAREDLPYGLVFASRYLPSTDRETLTDAG